MQVSPGPLHIPLWELELGKLMETLLPIWLLSLL